jgi:hypothetical protein
MPGQAVVRRGVLVRRAIAAADMAASKAETQVEPLAADPEAVLATVRAGDDLGADVEMPALGAVRFDRRSHRRDDGRPEPDQVNRAMSASAAQVRKWVAPQTGSIPSMKLSSLNPNTSIVIPHGDSFTPSSTARSRSSSMEATP